MHYNVVSLLVNRALEEHELATSVGCADAAVLWQNHAVSRYLAAIDLCNLHGTLGYALAMVLDEMIVEASLASVK